MEEKRRLIVDSVLCQLQVSCPFAETLMVTPVAVEATVPPRQRTPDAPEAKLREVTLPLALADEQFTVGPLEIVPGWPLTPPEAMNVAHSLAMPMASPTAEPAAAAARA